VDWWRDPLRRLVAGRRVILVGGVAAGWTSVVPALRDLGATDVLVVATDGAGAGPQPDCQVAAAEPARSGDDLADLRAALARLAEAPPELVEAVETFDAERTAVVFGVFLAESPRFVGRPLVAHRRPEWVALEDKTVVDALLDRAGVGRAPSTVVPVAEATARWRELDAGDGTVWSADARDGFHGGAMATRWITDDAEAEAATITLGRHADAVRIMPFLQGIATSIHGIVLPDGVVALRPVELVTLRRGHELRYSGCATFWDPPDDVREEMRAAARRLGEQLRREVDFRGAFTLDGVATRDGFRPTEVNPRFGAGLSVITRGLDAPLNLVLDLVVAGQRLETTAAELEDQLLAAADASRNGGTWQLHVATPEQVDERGACYVDGSWRWAGDGEEPDASVAARDGFARAAFAADRTPIGASVGPRAVDFWRFADAELGTDVGPLTAPPDRCVVSPAAAPSTRP
jgi:hypothetical protein